MSSPRKGVATLGVPHEDVVDPVDADAALVALDDLAHEALDPALAELLGRLALVRVLVGRGDDLDVVLGVELAVADRDEELLLVLDLELVEDAAHLPLVLEELGRADPRLVELPLEELLAEALALVPLLGP